MTQFESNNSQIATAKMANIGEDLTNCPVCFEVYEETEDRMPRILPCHHTFCERCLKQILRKKSLVCPECRLKHPAPGGTRTYPQNKYIVANIQLTRRAEPPVLVNIQETEQELILAERFSKCATHGKEASLYCYGNKCQKAICQLCLIKHHRNHEVVDIHEELKEKGKRLSENLQKLKEVLEGKKSKMLEAKKDIKKKNKSCVVQLQTTKEEHLRMISERYDELIKEANGEMKHGIADIDDELVTLNKDIELLDTIKHKNNPEEVTKDEMAKGFQTVRAIAGNVFLNFSGSVVYRYNEYYEGDLSPEEVLKTCGCVIQNEGHVMLSDPKDSSLEKLSLPEEKHGKQSKTALPRFVKKIFSGDVAKGTTNVTNVGCRVIQSVGTKYTAVYHLSPVDGTTVVVCGKTSDGQHQMIRYDLETAVDSGSTSLKDRPSGMTEAKQDGKSCLVFSYRDENKIEFRDVYNLKQILKMYSVSQQPSCMTSSTSNLVYVDTSKTPRQVLWLEYSASPPRLSGVSHTRLENIRDICCLKHAHKHLLVAIRDDGGVSAYNKITDKLEWSVKGFLSGTDKQMKACSLAADGEGGHLFVCDEANYSVQMFSADGVYLGCMLKEGEQSVGRPLMIRWCEDSSCLVALHSKGLQYYLSVLSPQTQ